MVPAVSLPAMLANLRGARRRPPQPVRRPTKHLNPGAVPPKDSAVAERTENPSADTEDARDVVTLQEITEQLKKRAWLEDSNEHASDTHRNL